MFVSHPSSPYLRYSVAVIAPTIALFMSSSLLTVLAQTEGNLYPFIAAVAVSAWYGGLASGLIATVISVLQINYFLSPPFYEFSFHASDVVSSSVFILLAVMISYIEERRLRAEQKERERRLEAEALQSTAALLSSTLDLDEVYDRILEHVSRVVRCNASNLAIIDGASLRYVRIRNYKMNTTETPQPARIVPLRGTEPIETIHRTLQPVITPDIANDPAWARWPEREKLHSYLGAPIRINNQVIGFISVLYETPNFYTPVDADRLTLFAEQGAIAIQNARAFSQSRELAALDERARLARELHDSVSQTLFISNIVAESAMRQWNQKPEKAYALLSQVHQLTNNALAEMRVLLLELRPRSLEQVNFDQLLSQFVDSLRGRRTVDFEVDIGSISSLPLELKLALYRIVQEALNNAVKHSNGSRIYLSAVQYDDRLELMVEDDGEGFDLARVSPTSLGLGIMRERAAEVGATLVVDSSVGNGTRIKIICPFQEGEHDNGEPNTEDTSSDH